MIEQLHFNYDLDFVLEQIANIGVEKIICVDDEVIKVNGKEYLKYDLSSKHCDELDNRTIGTFLHNYLEEKYPDGCMIDTPMFDELANVYLNHLCENSLEIINYDEERKDSYVESKSLNKRIYCRMGQHYGATLNLAWCFFGKGDYTVDDICTWIKNDITICSEYTSVDKVIRDFEYMNDPTWIRHYREYTEYLENQRENLKIQRENYENGTN